MCGCTRNGAARNKKQKVKASRWKMEAVGGSRKPAGDSQKAGAGSQQKMEAVGGSRKPAGDSQ